MFFTFSAHAVHIEWQELIRLYNCGQDRYDAQTHAMTYRLVSGKGMLGARPRGRAIRHFWHA